MFETALNKTIIPHIWKLANIVLILKPNKDTDKGTSYRPISLLSVIAKLLEKSLLPYITANIQNKPMQHGYKTQHSTVTALHTLNNTVAKGFNEMAPPARTITVALNIKLAFHKVASFHPHYLTFTPQTYHHPVHRFRSWPMQTTSQSHPHTQVRVQPRNTNNQKR